MSNYNTCKYNMENSPPHECDVCDSLDTEDNNENNFYIKLVHDKNGNEVEISKIKLSEYINKITANIVDALIPSEKN